MRNHVAAVQTGVSNEERGQSLFAGQQLVRSPLRNAPPFVRRQCHRLQLQGQRLAMEIASGEHLVLLRKDQRVVRHGVDLVFQHDAGSSEGIAAGSVYLGGAPE